MLALLWQDAPSHSPLAAGLLVTPFSLGSVVGASSAQRLTRRIVIAAFAGAGALLMVVTRRSVLDR